MSQHNALPDPPSSADYLGDFERLMTFIRTVRDGVTIEQARQWMRPNNSRVELGWGMERQQGQPERYLVFARAGSNPVLTVDSAGLVITRYNLESGVEDTDPGSPTAAGTNQLRGTAGDTLWYISGEPM